MNKKILLISNMFPSKKDPTYGTFVQNFKKQMTKEQFDITQTALIRGRGKNIFEKIIKYIKFFRNVITLVKQNDYDLIYVHYIGHSLLPLIFVQKDIKKPLILNAHGSDVFTTNKMKKYIQTLVTPIIQNANILVVPSSYFKEVIHKKFHIEENKIFISPSGGIDTNLFKTSYIKKKNNTFIIGYVSRIDQGKGWDILLKAIKLLRDNGIEHFKVLIIGGGTQEQKLLNMIKNLNLENCVDFIGRVPHRELVHYYNKMNVFAFTTKLAESLGLVGLEAMSCGVPVIGSNIGGLKGYIENGYNGELFEPGNIDELSEKIKKFILMEEEVLNKYVMHAITTAQKYDCNIVSHDMSNKLKHILQ